MEVQNLFVSGAAFIPETNPNVNSYAVPIAAQSDPAAQQEETAQRAEIKTKENDVKPALRMPSADALIKSTNDVNKHIKMANRRLDLSIHERTHQLLVKVLDDETGEVIREVPPEKSLDFLANLLERAGILVNKKA